MNMNSRAEHLHPWDNLLIRRHRCEGCERVFECALCTTATLAASSAEGAVSSSLYAKTHEPSGDSRRLERILVCERCA